MARSFDTPGALGLDGIQWIPGDGTLTHRVGLRRPCTRWVRGRGCPVLGPRLPRVGAEVAPCWG